MKHRVQISTSPTHQQAGGDRDNVGYGVFSGDILAGFGNVAEDIAMDNSSKDEVNVSDQDES